MKATSSCTVEKIILSFGLNNRGQNAEETAIKQMLAAFRAVKKKFPFAEVWIPLINHSRALIQTEIETLQAINAYINKKLPFIPKLDKNKFKTERDNIHWTGDTASAMFEHWISYLNSTPP